MGQGRVADLSCGSRQEEVPRTFALSKTQLGSLLSMLPTMLSSSPVPLVNGDHGRHLLGIGIVKTVLVTMNVLL